MKCELLTAKHAADALGVSRQFIYRHVAAGDLPALRLGPGPKAPIRIDVEDLAALVVPATPEELARR